MAEPLQKGKALGLAAMFCHGKAMTVRDDLCETRPKALDDISFEINARLFSLALRMNIEQQRCSMFDSDAEHRTAKLFYD